MFGLLRLPVHFHYTCSATHAVRGELREELPIPSTCDDWTLPVLRWPYFVIGTPSFTVLPGLGLLSVLSIYLFKGKGSFCSPELGPTSFHLVLFYIYSWCSTPGISWKPTLPLATATAIVAEKSEGKALHYSYGYHPHNSITDLLDFLNTPPNTPR